MAARSLRTERLLLRAFEPEDAERLFTLYGDPAVMAIRKIGTQTRAGSDRQLAEILEHWQRRGFGLFAVLDGAGGAFLGECGLREIAPGDERVEISYGLRPQAWGRGLAGEAARAVLAHGFGPLSLATIHGLARADNTRSIHLLRKLGMTHQETIAGPDHDVVRFAVHCCPGVA